MIPYFFGACSVVLPSLFIQYFSFVFLLENFNVLYIMLLMVILSKPALKFSITLLSPLITLFSSKINLVFFGYFYLSIYLVPFMDSDLVKLFIISYNYLIESKADRDIKTELLRNIL